MANSVSTINNEETTNCDQWGFYIDIENLPSKFPNNEYIIREKYKLHNVYYNKKYGLNNSQIDIEEKFYDFYTKNNTNYLINITSTTLLTAVITYVILFVI